MGFRSPRSLGLFLAGLATCWALCFPRSALAVPFLLPEGEPSSHWQAALAIGGGVALEPHAPRVTGSPWVELQRTAQPDRWRLRVRDHQGTLHELEVPQPVSEGQREELVVLAASLLHPVAGGAGDFWGGVASAELPPPLPVEPPPLPVVPPPLPAVPPPLPVEPPLVVPPPVPVEPVELEPSPPVEPAAPVEPPPASPTPVEPAPADATSPPVLSPPEVAGAVIFTRLLGVMDTGLEAVPAIAPGGGVQMGVLLPHSLQLGVGFQLEAIRSLAHPEQSAERHAQQREGDAHLVMLWSPAWKVAPVVGARFGVLVRTVYLASLQDGEYGRRVVAYDTDGEPLGPVPLAGLELGLSVPAGAGVRLQPYAQLQIDLGRPLELELFEDTITELPWYSLHAGLALHLQPDARSE